MLDTMVGMVLETSKPVSYFTLTLMPVCALSLPLFLCLFFVFLCPLSLFDDYGISIFLNLLELA